MKDIISFPHLGDYHIPIAKLLRKLTKKEVIPAPPITKKTIELGSKYAPDTVCVPFKYNLGNYIEALDNGATILFQAGGGCRYRYYAEVQEKILKDLNYNFHFFKLISRDHVRIFETFHLFKELNPKLKFSSFIHTIIYTVFFIYYMDKCDNYIRKNIGFEKEKHSFQNLKIEMLKKMEETNYIFSLTKIYWNFKKKLKKLPVAKPKNTLKIAVIGELYTAMEPFSTYFLEEELAKMNIEIKRFTNLSYLLWQKAFHTKYMLFKSRKYCKYTLGADGLDNVYRVLYAKKHHFDGIIHTKPFGCTPEIGALPIIQKAASDANIPILFFSFDNQTSQEGIKTRLEAFYDLIYLRKEKLCKKDI